MLTKGDKLLIGAVLATALIFLGWGYIRKNGLTTTGIATIRSEGQVVEEVGLFRNESRELKIKGPLGVSTAKVSDGRVQMLSSPCKDKICIKQGQISESGQSIVCVPNEVSITIETKGEVDEITR